MQTCNIWSITTRRGMQKGASSPRLELHSARSFLERDDESPIEVPEDTARCATYTDRRIGLQRSVTLGDRLNETSIPTVSIKKANTPPRRKRRISVFGNGTTETQKKAEKAKKRWKKLSQAGKLEQILNPTFQAELRSTRSRAARLLATSVDDKEGHDQDHHQLIRAFNLRRMTSVNAGVWAAGEECLQHKQGWAVARFTMHPESNLVTLWYSILACLVVFEAVYLPYDICFIQNDSAEWQTTKTIFLIFFGFDIFVDFNVAYYRKIPARAADPQSIALRFATTAAERQSLLVTDRFRIAKNYITSWFLLDALVLLPAVYEPGPENRFIKSVFLLKALKIPSMITSQRVFTTAKALLPKRYVIYQLQYSALSNVLRLLRLLWLILYLIHILGCLWYSVAGDEGWKNRFNSNDTNMFRYTSSIYAALIMLMGEDSGPQTFYEYFFNIFAIMLGAIVVAIIFGNVAVLVNNLSADTLKFREKMENLIAAMSHLALPMPLQQRIQLYYRYTWQQYHTLDGDPFQIIPELSSTLQTEVNLLLNASLIKSTSFLKICTPECVQAVVQGFKNKVFMPMDNIVNQGDIIHGMYFIQRGELQEVQKKNLREKLLRFLGHGEYFGESSLLQDCQSVTTLRASTFCTVCYLSRIDFDDIFSRYRDERVAVERAIVVDRESHLHSSATDTTAIPVIVKGKGAATVTSDTEILSDEQQIKLLVHELSERLGAIEQMLPQEKA